MNITNQTTYVLPFNETLQPPIMAEQGSSPPRKRQKVTDVRDLKFVPTHLEMAVQRTNPSISTPEKRIETVEKQQRNLAPQFHPIKSQLFDHMLEPSATLEIPASPHLTLQGMIEQASISFNKQDYSHAKAQCESILALASACPTLISSQVYSSTLMT